MNLGSFFRIVFVILLSTIFIQPQSFGFGILIETNADGADKEETALIVKGIKRLMPNKLGDRVHEEITEKAADQVGLLEFALSKDDNWLNDTINGAVRNNRYMADAGYFANSFVPSHLRDLLKPTNTKKLADGVTPDQVKDAFKEAVQMNLVFGVLYNDDPNGYLIPETAMHDAGFADLNGITWGYAFLLAMDKVKDDGGIMAYIKSKVLKGLTKLFLATSATRKIVEKIEEAKGIKGADGDYLLSSHFGLEQYMHAMGASTDSRDKIKGKMMGMAGHAWKVATGLIRVKDINARHRYEYGLKRQCLEAVDYPIGDGQRLQDSHNDRKLVDVLSACVHPQGGPIYFKKDTGIPYYTEIQPELGNEPGTEGFLFRARYSTGEKRYHTASQKLIHFRALGSLLHMIQDSYAKGHAVRKGWEDNTNSGSIRYFQDYAGQDGHKHGEFDTPQEGRWDAWEKIPGAETATQRSAKVIEMFKNRCGWKANNPWNGAACSGSEMVDGQNVEYTGMEEYLDKVVFALDSSEADTSTRSHPSIAAN